MREGDGSGEETCHLEYPLFGINGNMDVKQLHPTGDGDTIISILDFAFGMFVVK